MRAYERFLRYAVIDTTSDKDNAGGHPSTKSQFTLAHLLVDEMKAIGFENAHVDEHCYVYGWIPASPGCESLPGLGLIAHLDTATEVSGANVKPVLHENYDGGDVTLPSGRVLSASELPGLAQVKGETLITASGDTLLGADDKAGIADILTACDEIIREGLPHPRLCVAFTPDEEIGVSTALFDVEKFGASYAYTVDGCDVDQIEYETFNAARAIVTFTGVSVHPGMAKDIMVNASRLAAEYTALIPAEECPERTEGYEGFYHLDRIMGGVEEARVEYMIRDHDKSLFESRKETMEKAAQTIRARHGENSCAIDIQDTYYNMREVIVEHFHLVEHARAAIHAVGLEPVSQPVRGGTDGASLSFRGLPCPNLGTGAFYIHGPNEFTSVERLDRAVKVLKAVVAQYAKG